MYVYVGNCIIRILNEKIRKLRPEGRPGCILRTVPAECADPA